MEWSLLLDAFRQLEGGKRVGTARYLHVSLVETLPFELREPLLALYPSAGIRISDAHVFKVELRAGRISLLHYPGFWSEAFPRLETSWTWTPDRGVPTLRRFDLGDNPPILHRKELLLASNHPARPLFENLTRTAEAAGLFANPQTIGRQRVWDHLLSAAGLRIDGHDLLPVPMSVFEESMPKDPRPPCASTAPLQTSAALLPQPHAEVVLRHKAAISRKTLSAPMQALWRHGFLDGQRTVFDYGCGRGDDVRALEAAGLSVGAWDPHFRPNGALYAADVVNLGFVINVIEDFQERCHALREAFSLATHILVVATLIGGRSAYERFRLFQDGILTSIGTFQKYYVQGEFESFVSEVLGREPITIAPGIVFVFKTDEHEQDFLAQRQRQRWHLRAALAMPRAERPARVERQLRVSRWVEHEALLEAFWASCLELGRLPEEGEFSQEATLHAALGSPKRVLGHLLKTHGATVFEQARAERMGDMLVYLALGCFARRASFGALSLRIRRDIKAFGGSYKTAVEEAQRLLFSIASPQVIQAACMETYERGLGHLDGDHSLLLHTSLASELPPVLRIYLGCATKLYGDVEEADLLKLHIQSGKVTLLLYDDFDGLEVPHLVERVKINLRQQRIDFFEYGGKYPIEPLHNKADYLRGVSR